MRSAASIAAAATALSAAISGVVAVPDAGTVHYTFEKRTIGSPELGAPRQLLNRQTVTTAVTNYQQALYLINVTVGTPPQSIVLQLDTGSSDIWFPSATSSVCRRRGEYCAGGSYDAGSSTTFTQLDDYPAFEIQYVDGSAIEGVYLTDVLNLGDTQITNLTMAAATQFSRDLGIMGIGFQAGESSNSNSGFTYPNVIDVLKQQGKIDSLSYSLWLDDLASNTGSILFGGVDSNKYTGSLVSLPIQRDANSGAYTSFTVAWTGLTITGSGNNINASPSAAQPAILDSGTTLLYLPDDITQTIYNGLGVISYDDGQVNTVPCSLASDDLTLAFEFGGSGGAKINVPLSELVLALYNDDGSVPRANGQTLCQIGIAAAGSNPILFGDTFLRSAYVVYDLDNLQIALGQTNFNANTGNGNVQAISSGAGIPGVTATASAASVENTFTGRPLRTQGTAVVSGIASSTRNASFKLTPTSSSASGSGSSSNGKNAASRPVADNSALAVLLVTLGAFFFGAMLI